MARTKRQSTSRRRKPAPPRAAPATSRAADADTLLDAALALAADKGWRGVTLSAVAAAAHVPLRQVTRSFPTRGEIARAFIRRIDAAMIEGGAGMGEGDSARDRLFDVIMRRFDAMAPYRAQIASLVRSLPADPALAVELGPQALISAEWLLAAAGLDGDGPMAILRTMGLAAVFLDSFRIWLDDETEDMAKTMAVLDRNLIRAGRLAAILDRRRA